MRDLRDKVRFAPSQGQYKVYVIDEAHQLTSEAFNALLKTLEEPPPHAIFVLATTESGKIPATIVSRTQRFDLRRIPYKGVVAQLAKICEQEGLKVEPAALEAIARHAQGSLRDAESVLDMVAAFSEGGIKLADIDELLGVSEWEETSALFDALASNDGAAGVRIVGKLVDEGRDLRLFVKRAIDHTRALVLANAQGKPPETASEGVAAKIWEQAPKFQLPRLAAIAKRLIETEQHLKTSEGTPLPLELAILDLVTQPGVTGPATQGPPRREAPSSARSSAAPVADRGTPTRAQARTQERSGVIDLAARRAQTGMLTLADVQKAWAEMVAHVKEQSVGKASHLVKAEPVTVEGSTVVIGFDSDFARAYWQDRYRVELEQGLSERLSLTVRVRCVVQKLPADAPSPAEDPMLRAALETFRRPERILEIE
jgi:DNA polymerase III subunit gamma/tau